MDKAKLNGGSKAILSAVVMVAVLLVSGCETAKGFAKDSSNLWNYLKEADGWITENLW